MVHVLFFVLCMMSQVIDAYTFDKITVLTGPVGKKSSNVYDGQSATTRSLVEGLRKCGINANYNPRSIAEVGDVVHIVAGDVDVLQQIFALKKSGKVKRIIAGPNVACLITKNNNYIYSPEIDLRCSLSKWVEDSYLNCFTALNKSDFSHWYPGVNAQLYCPSDKKSNRSGRVLVYNKQQPALTRVVVQLVKEMGFEPYVLSYGNYNTAQYKATLEKVDFALFLSASESLGIALLESWAMDVPTLCWNPSQNISYLGVDYTNVSSCPLLNDEVGQAWKDVAELRQLIPAFVQRLDRFSPRRWVLENATDEICIQRLLRDIEIL